MIHSKLLFRCSFKYKYVGNVKVKVSFWKQRKLSAKYS